MQSLRSLALGAGAIVLATQPAIAAGKFDIWSQVPALMASTPQVKPEAPPSYPGAAGHHWYTVQGAASDGFTIRDQSFGGTLANGQTVYLVSLDTGGSGGVFVALLWTKVAGKTKFVGIVPSSSGHLVADFVNGQLVFKTPVYGPSDPNCCPSAIQTERDTLNGTRLVKLSVTKAPAPR